jgi:hypothetical protein
MTDDWQKEISEGMKRVKTSLVTLGLRKNISEAEKRRRRDITREVEDLLKTIEQDKSKGVHNFSYTQSLISKAEEKVQSIQKSTSKTEE